VIAGLISRAHIDLVDRLRVELARKAGQRATVLAALGDAAEWRELLAGEWRDRRGEHLAQAAAYRQLAAELGEAS
jgi:hypothetical protein